MLKPRGLSREIDAMKVRRHALGRGEDDAVGAADGEVDGAGLERLRALVRAGEFGRLERVGLAVVPGQVRLGHDQPYGLLGRPTIAEAKRHRLPMRRTGACSQHSRNARSSENASTGRHQRQPSEHFCSIVNYQFAAERIGLPIPCKYNFCAALVGKQRHPVAEPTRWPHAGSRVPTDFRDPERREEAVEGLIALR